MPMKNFILSLDFDGTLRHKDTLSPILVRLMKLINRRVYITSARTIEDMFSAIPEKISYYDFLAHKKTMIENIKALSFGNALENLKDLKSAPKILTRYDPYFENPGMYYKEIDKAGQFLIAEIQKVKTIEDFRIFSKTILNIKNFFSCGKRKNTNIIPKFVINERRLKEKNGFPNGRKTKQLLKIREFESKELGNVHIIHVEDHKEIIRELGKKNMLDFSLTRKKIGKEIFVSPLPYGENGISGIRPSLIHQKVHEVVTREMCPISDNKINNSSIKKDLEAYIEQRNRRGYLQCFSSFWPAKCGQYKIDAATKIIKLIDPSNDVLCSGMNLNELSACLEEDSTLRGIIDKNPFITELCSDEKRKAENGAAKAVFIAQLNSAENIEARAIAKTNHRAVVQPVKQKVIAPQHYPPRGIAKPASGGNAGRVNTSIRKAMRVSVKRSGLTDPKLRFSTLLAYQPPQRDSRAQYRIR